jgi:DNA-binding LacI/PurR family transcriptional regulator
MSFQIHKAGQCCLEGNLEVTMDNGDKDLKIYTSDDVASIAGVSQSTVSRVFAGSANVSDKKRKIVLEVAEKLGYQPNAIARGLSSKKTKMIGIVVHNFSNPFYSEVLARFYSKFSAMGYHLIFVNSENEEIQENEIGQLTDYNVEGVIITDALLSSSAAERFLRKQIPIILFNRYIKDSKSSAVYCDNYLAGRQIATYLVDLGHTCFAFITGPLNTSTTIDRKRGFEEVLSERGISKLLIESGNYTYESGFRSAQELIARPEKVDGIFCANDITALGAMEAIRMAGLRIPEDISIVGFDDIPMASWPSYALTTWQQPIEEMVESAIELLMNEINGMVNRPATTIIKGHLIIRNSVNNKKNTN